MLVRWFLEFAQAFTKPSRGGVTGKKQPGKLWKKGTKLDIASWHVVSCCVFDRVLFVVSAPLPKCAAIALGSPSCQANGETTYHQLKWDSYWLSINSSWSLNYELCKTYFVSVKSKTLDALKKMYVFVSVDVSHNSEIYRTPPLLQSRGSARVCEVDGTFGL